MTFLKNYTSTVPVSETIRRIEAVLIRCCVSGITKEYGPTAQVSALRFEIGDSPKVSIRLPVDRDRALDALWMNYVNGDSLSPSGELISYNSNPHKKKKKSDFRDQAERTAWKIMQDWVEVQMSMIQMKQADTLEVFLPYVWDGRTTVYGRLKESGFKALLPEKT